MMNIKGFCLTAVIFLSLTICTKKCLAQQQLTLYNIKRFELFERGGGLSGHVQVLEVIKKDNKWLCYQTRERTVLGDNTTLEFLQYIPTSKLVKLLKIINQKDTAIHINLFKIKSSELISYVDSVLPKVNEAVKTKMIETLKSKSMVYDALCKVLVPFKMDDKAYYKITIVTKANQNTVLEAHSFADLYNLPWSIDGYKSFNPNISLIFESIVGHDNFQVDQRKWLNRRIVTSVYREHFK